MTVHVNAEYAHEMTARERLCSILVSGYKFCYQTIMNVSKGSSVIGASSSVVIGWDKNSTVLSCN